ncbi:MAG: hypothetical protein OEL57_09370 [Trichlorobacter sp.]|uniref:hypothetical protein n=1 Tax=Trichlorobacter sp. TaxID=2911007 RepID=UPI00256D4F01|nr:hypothetical protein [Trichlorobacter sp.]MDK9718100.1 hypothetical protein [Trichlorobacter sp.]
MPDLPAVPVKSEAPSTQPTPSTPTTKPSTSSNSQASSQDSVTLSSTALDMSKALIQQHEQKSEIKQEAVKQEAVKQQVAAETEEKKPYKAATKSYPPYMGNSEELKLLKESSPALYREILRMIIPTPLNISYADKQSLQSSQGMSSSKPTVSTTA